jgi:hypothetical protein
VFERGHPVGADQGRQSRNIERLDLHFLESSGWRGDPALSVPREGGELCIEPVRSDVMLASSSVVKAHPAGVSGALGCRIATAMVVSGSRDDTRHGARQGKLATAG